MTIRLHWKRPDGFGEYKNIFQVIRIERLLDDTSYKLICRNMDYTIHDSEIVGLPEIVER